MDGGVAADSLSRGKARRLAVWGDRWLIALTATSTVSRTPAPDTRSVRTHQAACVGVRLAEAVANGTGSWSHGREPRPAGSRARSEANGGDVGVSDDVTAGKWPPTAFLTGCRWSRRGGVPGIEDVRRTARFDRRKSEASNKEWRHLSRAGCRKRGAVKMNGRAAATWPTKWSAVDMETGAVAAV